MTTDEDLTHWIGRLKEGDPMAARKIWESYSPRLLRIAHSKLQGVRCGAADEEDVALSAFASFCRGVERERFPRLADRNDLWKLLLVITVRKAYDLRTRQNRIRQGGGKVSGESALPGSAGTPTRPNGIQEVEGREPTPVFAAQLAEQYQRLLDVLDDADLRVVAVKKLEGYTNQEIAAHFGRSIATVERKLRLIRHIWDHERKADTEA